MVGVTVGVCLCDVGVGLSTFCFTNVKGNIFIPLLLCSYIYICIYNLLVLVRVIVIQINNTFNHL